MKYFKHLFDRTAEALVTIFYEDRHADKVIEYYFKNNKKWGKRDRQFVAETIYGCVRWWRLYEHLSQSQKLEGLSKAHKIMAAHLVMQNQELPEWYHSTVIPETVREQYEQLPEGAVKQSFPDWIYNLAMSELGDVWPKTARELNQQARVVLRVNTLKVTRDQAMKELQQVGVQLKPMSSPDVPDGLILTQRANVFTTEAFKKGYFEMQDGSSQLVGRMLNPQPGERVIDACAGAGGKSLHLAALMQNKGKIISLDVIQWKLDELKKRSRRAGVSIIEPRWIESNKVIKRLHESADAVLLDVPCSGLGVLKRIPDSKWKLQPETIAELRETQKNILSGYSLMTKKGGRLVYSTCSILPSENQRQVEEFLKNHPDWKQLNEKILLPQEDGFDGFYMSLLQRS